MDNFDHGAEWSPRETLADKNHKAQALFAVSAVIGVVGAASVTFHEQNAVAIVNVLALFAVIGVFGLLCWVSGLVHFGAKVVPHDIAMGVFSTSGDGMIVTDAEGAAVVANQSYRDLIRHRDGPLLGMDRMVGSWAGSAEEAFRLMRAARRDGGWSREFVTGLPEWPTQFLSVSVRPMRLAGSRNSGALLVWRIVDVTRERMQASEAKAKLSFADVALTELNIGVAAINSVGGVQYMNEGLASWLDRPEDPSDALNIFDFVQQKKTGAAKRFDFSEVSPVEKVLDIDLVRQDGPIPVRMYYKIVRLAGDAEPKMLAVFIGQRAAPTVERASVAIDSQFAEVFEAAPIAIGTAKASGELLATNASLLHLLGLTKDPRDPALLSILDLVTEASRAPLAKSLQKAAANRAGGPPVAITLAADPQRTGRLYICPAPANGSVKAERQAMIYGVDTSDQRSLEEQIAQSQKMQAVGQLAGGVAHDFNNILTAIIGFSDLLLVKHRPGDPAFQDIMNIKQNANRAAGLVRQLLAFSSKQTLRPSVLSLTDVLEELSVLLDRLLGEKISSKVIHGRDLWPIKADENQLEQVIINLAVNARDAMAKGGQLSIRTANISERDAAKLSASGLAPGEYVLCEVRDNGCGIPADKLEKIFEPFYTTKEVGKGTGLGLSTVYGIVQQTGGHIVVESQLDVGTAFKVYLPRHIPAEVDKAVALAKPDKKEKPRDLTGSGTVLLVEDEEAVRTFASRALATRGYRVLQAVSGVDALEIMKRHEGEVDLVISDVVMPEMDGPALLKRLRAQNPDIKFIFISGYAEDAFKGAIIENEKFAFLAKPFSLKQLAAAVKEALSAST